MNAKLIKFSTWAGLSLSLIACSNSDERKPNLAAAQPNATVSTGTVKALPAPATAAEATAQDAIAEKTDEVAAPQVVIVSGEELFTAFNDQVEGKPSQKFLDLIASMKTNETLEGGKTANLETIIGLATHVNSTQPEDATQVARSQQIGQAYAAVVVEHFFANDLQAEQAWLASAKEFIATSNSTMQSQVTDGLTKAREAGAQVKVLVADYEKKLAEFRAENLMAEVSVEAEAVLRQFEQEKAQIEAQVAATEAALKEADAANTAAFVKGQQLDYIAALIGIRSTQVDQKIEQKQAEEAAAAAAQTVEPAVVPAAPETTDEPVVTREAPQGE